MGLSMRMSKYVHLLSKKDTDEELKECEFEGFRNNCCRKSSNLRASKNKKSYENKNSLSRHTKKPNDDSICQSSESDLLSNRYEMRTIVRKSYDKMIKDGLESACTLSSHGVSVRPNKSDALNNKTKTDNSMGSKNIKHVKEKKLNYYSKTSRVTPNHRHNDKNVAKNILRKAKNQCGKVLKTKNKDQKLLKKPRSESSCSLKKRITIKDVIKDNSDLKKHNISNRTVKGKTISVPNVTSRSRKTIPQKQFMEEYDGNKLHKTRKTHNDSSNVTSAIAAHARKPKYVSVEWVPQHQLGILEQPLVIDGKRQWKPSKKLQMSSESYSKRKINRALLSDEEKQLKSEKLTSRERKLNQKFKKSVRKSFHFVPRKSILREMASIRQLNNFKTNEKKLNDCIKIEPIDFEEPNVSYENVDNEDRNDVINDNKMFDESLLQNKENKCVDKSYLQFSEHNLQEVKTELETEELEHLSIENSDDLWKTSQTADYNEEFLQSSQVIPEDDFGSCGSLFQSSPVISTQNSPLSDHFKFNPIESIQESELEKNNCCKKVDCSLAINLLKEFEKDSTEQDPIYTFDSGNSSDDDLNLDKSLLSEVAKVCDGLNDQLESMSDNEMIFEKVLCNSPNKCVPLPPYSKMFQSTDKTLTSLIDKKNVFSEKPETSLELTKTCNGALNKLCVGKEMYDQISRDQRSNKQIMNKIPDKEILQIRPAEYFSISGTSNGDYLLNETLCEPTSLKTGFCKQILPDGILYKIQSNEIDIAEISGETSFMTNENSNKQILSKELHVKQILSNKITGKEISSNKASDKEIIFNEISDEILSDKITETLQSNEILDDNELISDKNILTKNFESINSSEILDNKEIVSNKTSMVETPKLIRSCENADDKEMVFDEMSNEILTNKSSKPVTSNKILMNKTSKPVISHEISEDKRLIHNKISDEKDVISHEIPQNKTSKQVRSNAIRNNKEIMCSELSSNKSVRSSETYNELIPGDKEITSNEICDEILVNKESKQSTSVTVSDERIIPTEFSAKCISLNETLDANTPKEISEEAKLSKSTSHLSKTKRKVETENISLVTKKKVFDYKIISIKKKKHKIIPRKRLKPFREKNSTNVKSLPALHRKLSKHKDKVILKRTGQKDKLNIKCMEQLDYRKAEGKRKHEPRIKHVCRRASVVFGHELATFEKSSEQDDFNLSALPKEEKQKILENDLSLRDLDDLPMDELIKRASEKDEKDVVIIQKNEKEEHTPKRAHTSSTKNGLRNSYTKRLLTTRTRKVRCNECENCLAPDCEQCTYCLDKKKFGGPGVIKKACMFRQCQNPRLPAHPNSSIRRAARADACRKERLSLVKSEDSTHHGYKEECDINSIRVLNNVTVHSSNDQKIEQPQIQKQKSSGAWDKSIVTLHSITPDYWEEYDPERILKQGFSLISSEMLPVKYVCFLCGSAGQTDLIFCSLCCEPFHYFCLEDGNFNENFSEETWCCDRCQSCMGCGLSKKDLLKCKKCLNAYHLDCIGPDYPSKSSKKNIWICPTCIKCKSCGGTSQTNPNVSWNFDLPFCSNCSQRKSKGSYCPICHQCYDDNDYECKMVQCAKCQLWVHAKCDDITDDMYEILSCLPESVVYTCPCCASEPVCIWMDAVHEELARGLRAILALLVSGEIINNHQSENVERLELWKTADYSSKDSEQFPPNKTGNLSTILRKLENKEYTVISNFYEEVLIFLQLNNLATRPKLRKLNKVMKLHFPWFKYTKHTAQWNNLFERIEQWQIASDKSHIVIPPYEDHNYAMCEVFAGSKETIVQPGKLRGFKEDPRKCLFCSQYGDGPPVECGRLIYCGQNDWVHVNCALWSAEVFEEVDGSLQNVHSAMFRGRSMRCEHCNNKGATIGCCIRGCPENYHFKCAQEENALFQDDKKVYCASHIDRMDQKKVSGDGFFIKHTKYVDLDGVYPKWKKKSWQNGLPPGCVHITIGSLTIENLGFLTEASDWPEALVPIEFVATRLFWSAKNPRQRVTYTIRTIEVKPKTETCESNIIQHHTIAHNVDKLVQNKVEAIHKNSTKLKKCKKVQVENNAICSENSTKSADILHKQKKKILVVDLSKRNKISNDINVDNGKVYPFIHNKTLDYLDSNKISVQNIENKTAELIKNSSETSNNSEQLLNSEMNLKSKPDISSDQLSKFDSNTTDIQLKIYTFDKNKQININDKMTRNKDIKFEYNKNDIKDAIVVLDKNIPSLNVSLSKIEKNNLETNTKVENKRSEEEINVDSKVTKIFVESDGMVSKMKTTLNSENLQTRVDNIKNDISSNKDSKGVHTEKLICPKPTGKKSELQKILKTYPLRSRRYQESIRLLKHYAETSKLTINLKRIQVDENCKRISLSSSDINSSSYKFNDNNNEQSEITLGDKGNENNNSRQLRKTPARLCFQHTSKHNLLLKKKKAYNNILSSQKLNCYNHNKNQVVCSKEHNLLMKDENLLYQNSLNTNLNNFVNNEYVVAVGEIGNYNNYLVKNKDTDEQSNGGMFTCNDDFQKEKTFKCKNCKRQYRTQDSCRKHEQTCDFIVDSSSTDEDEEIHSPTNADEEETDNCSSSDVGSSKNNSVMSPVTEITKEADQESISSLTDNILLSENCEKDEDTSNDKQTPEMVNYDNHSAQFNAPDDCSIQSVSLDDEVLRSVNDTPQYKVPRIQQKEVPQKFILPKPNCNPTVASSRYNATESVLINNTRMPIIIDGNINLENFNRVDESSIHNISNAFVIPQQQDTSNASHPICIQNTCQMFSTGVNILQNPHLSYLGSITISNQESLSLAFNLADSPMQLPSNIIMDQVQTSQIASNVPLPVMNYPVLNTSYQNTHAYIPQPTVVNPQVMYVNHPMLTQTQISESIFIVNSESPQSVLYDMSGNTLTSSQIHHQSISNTYATNINSGCNSNTIEQSWENTIPENGTLIMSSATSLTNQNTELMSQSETKVLPIQTIPDQIRNDQIEESVFSNKNSFEDNSDSKTSKSSENNENSNKYNNALAELQKLAANKPLIEVIQKAAQQMLKLSFKNCHTQKAQPEETPKKSDSSCSGITNRILHQEQRVKYKASRIRRNSTSSDNDLPASNTTGKVSRKSSVQSDDNVMSVDGSSEKSNNSNDKPYIMFEISSDDGLCIKSSNIDEAWKNVVDQIQDACTAAHLKRKNINQNGIDGLSMMGLTNNAVKYLLEQLPGAQNCIKYSFSFHSPHAEEETLLPENPSGCARSEAYHMRKDYDMFSFLASKHRCPPEYEASLRDEEVKHKSPRRASNIELPMAMRFRHLKNSAREAVGVYRSPIHGRGLFCKRTIEAGEMIIEYAGEVIRSILTDSRETYYESKGIGCYMFRIDDNEVVDATMHGNAARFINHSCEPNCYSKVITVDGKKHIVIFAMKRIFKGEELTYNYKFPIEDEKIPCTCGSKRCRKYLN